MSELVVVLAVLGLWALFAVVHLSGSRTSASSRRKIPKSTIHISTIHRAMILHAQGNNGWYPGVGSQGRIIDPSPEYRYGVLLQNRYLTPESVSSLDEVVIPWNGGPVTRDNYSYAMLRIDDPEKDAGRITEWRETANGQAAILSDRNTGTTSEPASIFTQMHPEHDDWKGVVGWNDNSAYYVQSVALEATQYGNAPINHNDHLFEASGAGDAKMIFSRHDFLPAPRRMRMQRPTPYLIRHYGMWLLVAAGMLFVIWLWATLSGTRIKRSSPSRDGGS